LAGGLPRPCNRIGNVLLLQAQFRQLGAHGIAALDANRGQDDLAVAGFYVEIFRRANGRGDVLGQGELVLRSHFGKHDRLQ
jgi:hypothetical protein